MINFFKEIFYFPLYNALIFLIEHLPHADLGLAVIVMTIVVKLIIFPMNLSAVRTQVKMKELEPQLAQLREKYKDDKNEQAKQLMAFYKENDLNPFGGILPALIQLPVIISLYSIFRSSGLPQINQALLYHFVQAPLLINVHFLGTAIDVAQKSIVLAIIVAISQVVQVQLVMPPMKKHEGEPTMKSDFARSMNLQMRYVLPLFTAYISYITSGAVALYFITSNLFAIGQELYVRKTIKNKK
jgi:YidC/Oxa1 family membrane protein insertase